MADRTAQVVAKLTLEPVMEPVFHPDSYGYRARKSALDAVGVARKRCFRMDWVIDLDIRSLCWRICSCTMRSMNGCDERIHPFRLRGTPTMS